jgi:tetratricopeptide (TPR) repeat protein
MRVLATTLLVLFAIPGCVWPAKAQEASPPSTLRGTVRDTQGKAIDSADVRVASVDGTQTFTVRTDAQGNYSFPAMHAGTYTLRAGASGYTQTLIRSIFLEPATSKTVDLTLHPEKGDAQSVPVIPSFFDEPNFAVSGVTDTTSLGGHGSDTIVRTREALARETASIGKTPVAANPVADPAASAVFEKSLRERAGRDPQSFEANRQLGKCLLAEAKATEAIPYLDRAAQLKPSDFDNAYDLAFANFTASHYESAREQAQALLPHHDTAVLHHLIADTQEKLEDSLDAVREYQRAAALEPTEPYLFDWGAELLLHRAPEPAIEVFNQGERLFPKSARMLIGLGAASFERGDVDQAVKQVSAASDLAPDDDAPYLFLGKMELTQNGASDDLLAMLRRFASVHPENAAANYFYAVALWKRAKTAPNDAVAETDAATVETLLRNALRIDANFAAAQLQLGILYFQKHDFAEAIAEFQQAIRFASGANSADFSSTAEEAHYRLAQAYRETRQPDKAKAELKLYDQMTKESAQKTEDQRHQLGQFLYTLRDQPQNH